MKPQVTSINIGNAKINAIQDNNAHGDDYLLVREIGEGYILAIVSDGVSQCTSGLVASCIGSHSVASYIERTLDSVIGEIDFYDLLFRANRKANATLSSLSMTLGTDWITFVEKLEEYPLSEEEIEELQEKVKSAVERGDEISFKATFNVNLICPKQSEGRRLVYNLCGGDSPSYIISHLHDDKKASVRPLYTNTVISCYFNNLSVNTMPHIGSVIMGNNQLLLITSDGVNLHYEESKMTPKGRTFITTLREEGENFCSMFHEKRLKQRAIHDDFSCILIAFGKGKKLKKKEPRPNLAKSIVNNIPSKIKAELSHSHELISQKVQSIQHQNSRMQEMMEQINDSFYCALNDFKKRFFRTLLLVSALFLLILLMLVLG